ncbi:MAG: Holliday junction branch migration DNA helicase RuvB [Bacteriovoracaceae bacterium]|jgi:Holliday junction DNA helicase RuvB|nr:Holliday junction branch migration DNA helicase RuvB [Bacteriovoracaceae bacterium]
MEIENRFLNAGSSDIEVKHENRLRPKDFSEYIGQQRVVENVDLMVKSALKRKSAMDHVLLSGPPGLGKTSLAMIIADALGSDLHVISGPAIEKKGDLAAVLTNIKPTDVLFIDEIHRMHISVEEILYSAMEDFRLDILIGQGASARTMQIDLVPFTLIGATTRSGLLSNPLRDRFMAHLHFDYYQSEQLAQILHNNSIKMEIELTDEAKIEVARRSRGTPRIANRILRRVRDFALIEDTKIVELSHVEKGLKLLDIDNLGLDSMDRKILEVISSYYNNGPVGIEALSATLGEDKQTIEEVYEPFLLKEGLLIRTPRGRVLSEKAIEHIGN